MTVSEFAVLYVIYGSSAVAAAFVLTRLYLIKVRRDREHAEAWALCEDDERRR